MAVEHREAVLDGGAAQGGFLQEACGRGVVDEVVTDMAVSQNFRVCPRAAAAVWKHPYWCGIDDNQIILGNIVCCVVVYLIYSVWVAADKQMFDAKSVEPVCYGLRSSAGAENKGF